MSASPCGQARRVLWPDAGPRETTPEIVAAQRHVETCEACRAFLGEMRTFATAVASLAPRETAPAAVRERLFTAVARERAGGGSVPRARTLRWAPAAAVALLALVAGGVLVRALARRASGGDLASVVADEHVRSSDEGRVSASDPELVTRWLTPRVPFAVHVPALPDAELVGARVVPIDGRRAAVIEYRVRGTRLSYFVIPEPERPGTPAEPPRLEVTSRAGYGVLSWREPGLVHAMVGDLPSTELTSYARACIEQMGRTVARPEPARRARPPVPRGSAPA